ncbi:MAG TPA: hypothetical protein PKI14_00885 [Fervidobacterium sp.]|nr:hypothetical protein [Fervidobacterium sp.]HOK88221.1 hypothetical protein [Fervidobacterium sp.]HOM73747.1 hypothetical protein [Fervidobacterium sp.]HOQ38792.1 hypothetical protein [Fervidobacterium sp.]HPP18190.1 hypothetical protein [Fervidobacterium sp.]
MKNVLVFSLVVFTLFTTFGFAGFYLNVGSVQIGSDNYLVYEFGPEFTIGPLTLGLTLTTYATDLTTGQFYFGAPSLEPSSNIVDGINIASLGLDFGTYWFRYGSMKPLTYGMGFTFNGYSNPQARVFDTGVRTGALQASVHLPYELVELTTFTYEQSDSLYTASTVLQLAGLDLSLFGGMETYEAPETVSSIPLQYAGGVSVTKSILGFSVGAELGAQMWKDGTLGYGAFAGIFGDFGIFQLVAGPYYTLDGFSAWLVDKNYHKVLTSPGFGPENYPSEIGYIARIGLTTSSYGKVVVSLKGNFEGDVLLAGEGQINIPAIGGTNGLVLYGYLYDSTPFENGQFLDSDSSVRITIAYPAFENFYVGIKYVWNGNDNEWLQTAFVGGSTNF